MQILVDRVTPYQFIDTNDQTIDEIKVARYLDSAKCFQNRPAAWSKL